MTARMSNRRAEPAHHGSDGIDVYVLGDEQSSNVIVSVLDKRARDGFEFEVDGCRVLDAFNHPFEYAAASRETTGTALTDTLAAAKAVCSRR